MKSFFRTLIRTWEAKIVLFFFLVFSVLSLFRAFDALEVKTIDRRFLARPPHQLNSNIAMVYISDDCIDQLGKWPWPRQVHAQALQILASAGARVVAFDIIFNDPATEDPAGDVALVMASRQAGNVVFPMFFSRFKVFDPLTSETRIESELFRPFPALASSALSLGVINVEYKDVNPDGIIRRLDLQIPFNNAVVPAFPLAIAAAYHAKNISSSASQSLDFPTVSLDGFQIDDGNLRHFQRTAYPINFLGGSTSGIFPTVYFSDLISGAANPALFKNKIVLIGPNAVGLGDIKLTPFGEMPGVLIHATIVQNLLQQDFVFHSGKTLDLAVLLGMSCLALLILFVTQTPLGGLVFFLLLAGSYYIGAFVAFSQTHMILEIVTPLLMLALQVLVGRFWQYGAHLRMAYHSLKGRNIDLEHANSNLDNRVKELTQLNEAGRTLPTILDLELLSQEVLKIFVSLWDARDAALFFFDGENESFQLVRQFGYEAQDASLFLFHPEVAVQVRQFAEEKEMIRHPQGQWFTVYLPLLVGQRFWGGIFLRERNPSFPRRESPGFWSTLCGMTSTALENAKLYHLATVDGLTKLYVRRFFQMQIEKEFRRAARYRHPSSLIMTDIDHFKKFNDTYGHQQGDVVLREVSLAVKASLRDVDIAARYGGEEFALILPQTDLEGTITVAERIRSNVEKLFIPKLNAENEFLRVTISLGVASFPENPAQTSEEMIKIADDCLYLAKNKGRNRVEFAQPTANQEPDLEKMTPEAP
jgi:diguanylate cyclase (GGDEF)-like protein